MASLLGESQIIPATIIPHMQFGKLPMRFFLEDLEEIRKQQKKLVGYIWDSRHDYVSSINGELFQFSVSPRGEDVFVSFWSSSGHYSLGEIRVAKARYDKSISEQSKDEWQEILRRMDRYVMGFINCSDCGKEMSMHEPHGSVFAGHYCQDCWTGVTGRFAKQGGWYKYQSSPGFYE